MCVTPGTWARVKTLATHTFAQSLDSARALADVGARARGRAGADDRAFNRLSKRDGEQGWHAETTKSGCISYAPARQLRDILNQTAAVRCKVKHAFALQLRHACLHLVSTGSASTTRGYARLPP
eukprot:6203037-Pleurochrysis_carterae.AAC.1